MSGHSHWSTIKHKKEANDKARGKSFSKLSRDILVAIHNGGGSTDPELNFHLREAIGRARAEDLPKENIQRLLERARDKADAMVEVVYEAIGPHGISFILKAATDNPLRTHAELCSLFERAGGRMVEKGGVMYLFEKCGLLQLGNVSEDKALEYVEQLNASDMDYAEGVCTLFFPYEHMSEALQKARGCGLTEAPEVIYKPFTFITLPEGDAARVEEIVSLLHGHDDIQDVFTNLQLVN